MADVVVIIWFGIVYGCISPFLVDALNVTEGTVGNFIDGENIQENLTTQDVKTNQVLLEVSIRIANVTSVTELYNLMVRYNHRYCNADLLQDLERNSKTQAEKAALVEMKKYCEEVKNEHEIHRRAFEIAKDPLNTTKIRNSNKQMRSVLKRSKEANTRCRVRKLVVELPLPPPGSTYFPRCTTVKRCSGCCQNPLHTCVPAPGKRTRVKRKVIVIQVHPSSSSPVLHTRELRVEQHSACRCACPVNMNPCSPLQEYNESNCSCKCRNDEAAKHCFAPRAWDTVECKCKCPPSLGCTSGFAHDEDTCKCAPVSFMQYSSSRGKIFNQVVE